MIVEAKGLKQCVIEWAIVLSCAMSIGCSEVKTEITIPATPTEVWKVLVDTKGYKDWNPTWRPKEGSLQQGAYVKYDYTQPGEEPIEMRFIVGKSERPTRIEQSAGTSGLFTNEHLWLLEEVDEGTRVTQMEAFSGILVLFSDLAWVEEAYSRVNEGLKAEVVRRVKSKDNPE